MDEPVELEKKPVEVQDCRKITYYFRRIYRNTKENRRLSTSNRLDLLTLGSQPIMPKNILDHRVEVEWFRKFIHRLS